MNDETKNELKRMSLEELFNILKNEELEISQKVDLICNNYNLSKTSIDNFDILD